jgi:hypothetical protein
VCFLDSDDEWHQEKLKSVYEVIQLNADLSVVCHNESIYSENSNSVGRLLKYGPNSHDMYKKMLVFGNRLSTSATSIRIKFLRDNDLQFNELEKYSTVEDYDLWLNLARKKAKFKFIPRSLGFYTVGCENMIFSSGMYCTNLEALLKQHVYNIQKFEKNKNNLWGVIQIRINICQIRYGESTSFFKMFSIITVFFQYPFYFLVFLNGYIKTKLQLF